jgi:hypothetical protein
VERYNTRQFHDVASRAANQKIGGEGLGIRRVCSFDLSDLLNEERRVDPTNDW